jgi:hypothetical protein
MTHNTKKAITPPLTRICQHHYSRQQQGQTLNGLQKSARISVRLRSARPKSLFDNQYWKQYALNQALHRAFEQKPFS